MPVHVDIEGDTDALACGLDHNNGIRFVVAWFASGRISWLEVFVGAVQDLMPLPGTDEANVSEGPG